MIHKTEIIVIIIIIAAAATYTNRPVLQLSSFVWLDK